MKKCVASMTIGLCSSILMTGVAFGAVTQDQAKERVNPHLPSGSVFLYSEIDDGCYELKYANEANQEGYKWNVNIESGALVSFESQRYQSRGGTKVTITKEEASKKVTQELTGAEILSATVDYDDDTEYEVRFKTDRYYGEYSIHPETGVVLERELKFTAWKNKPISTTGISREKAIELAKAQVKDGTVTDVDLDWERSVYCYEIELYKDGREYTVLIDASTGAVVASYSETEDWYKGKKKASEPVASAGSDIGSERAKQIALQQVPGGTVVKCKQDYEDGRLIYEVEIIKGRYEYELEILASSGAVVKNEMEYDD